MAWRPTQLNAKFGVVICNFKSAEVNHGLELWIGDTVHILEEATDWYRGFSTTKKSIKGIFPKSFVQLKECKVENPGIFEMSTPIREPVAAEVSNVLGEWGGIWKKLYLQREGQMFMALKQVMIDIIECRRQIMSDKLTQDQQRELRWKITQKIDWGNSKLNLDVIPRENSIEVDSSALSVPQLFKVHATAKDSVQTSTVEATKQKSGFATKSVAVHLFLSVKSFVCNIGEEALVLFSLYTSKKAAYISEKYMIALTKNGMPKQISKINNMGTLFTDIGTGEFANNVYLVCQIFREGKLLQDSKKNPSTAIRRPFGCAVAYVGDILTAPPGAEDDEEICMNIYNCHETEFYCIEDYIIKKQSGKLNPASSGANVCVGLKLYLGDLEKVIQENSMVLNADLPIAKPLGFPEVILPGDLRNDLYVTIDRAEFEKGQKSSGKNVEISMCVVSKEGKVLNNCIYYGVGEDPVSEYHSHVMYHNNNPKWNEIVKVELPIDLFYGSHLRFTFLHCSRHEGKSRLERIFAFSYLKLFQDDGTVVRDGQRNIFIYKNDSSVSFDDCSTYLALPVGPEDLEHQQSSGVVYAGPSRNPRESLSVKMVLCSTKLTQNSDLVGLLKWRMRPENLAVSLDSVLRVAPEEIVKFLQDVFDALFNILSEKGEILSMAVMKALYSILAIVMDKKYHRFQATIETYIQEHFSSTLAYRNIISSLNFLLANAKHHENREILKYAMKGSRLVIMFVIKSQSLHRRSSADFNEAEIRANLSDMFQACATMLASPPGLLDDVKSLTIENLPLFCDDVLKVFSNAEFSHVIRDCINAIQPAGHSIGILQIKRLTCIHDIVNTSLFLETESRELLLPVFIAHLNIYMERKQELMFCFEILADIINVLKECEKSDASGIDHLVKVILITILNTFLTIDRKGQLAGLAASCLIGIFRLMDEQHYAECLEIFRERRDMKDFLTKLFVAFRELVMYEVFPKDWFVLKTVANNLVLTAVQNFSKAFVEHFLHDADFDHQLWTNYFHLSVSFLTQPSLQLEMFIATKRERVLDLYGDMRQIMAFEILNMWETLDDQKISFIPSMIGPFLEVTLIADTALRKATIPIFFDMMKVEYDSVGSFKQVEAELINKLDIFVSSKKGDEQYEELFREIMTSNLSKCADPRLHHKGLKTVESITQLLKRLLDYRTVMNSVDCGMDQKMMCTVGLLEFYNDLQREDMYTRYIQKLWSLHSSCENHTEAGFTLLLHTNLLQWNERIIPSVLSFPEQSEWQRKEQLYINILDHFDKGKMWENGIRLCKELAQQYEVRLVDYVKLSEILRTQAHFYDNIMREIRPEPEYFRVACYGQGFARYLRDRIFVFRGLEYEKLGSFIQRLRIEFPNAEVLSKNTPPDQKIITSPLQFIQCCSVQPVASELSIFKGRQVDDKIASYYKVNEVDRFTYSRPFHKGKKSENEFSSLWLERTTMQTRAKLPSILRWSEVISLDSVELCPIENAIDSIRSKNRELADMISSIEKNPKLQINPLSMILNGIIDANVNGGISNYQQAFLSDEFLFLNHELEDFVVQLRTSLEEQVDLLGSGLSLHERLASSDLQPFHEKMLYRYEMMKHSIETGEPMEMTPSTPTFPRSSTLSLRPKSPLLSTDPRGNRRQSTQQGSPNNDNENNRKQLTMQQRITKRFSSGSLAHALSSPTISNNNETKVRKTESDSNLRNNRETGSTPSISEVDGEAGPPLPPRRVTLGRASTLDKPDVTQRPTKRFSVPNAPSGLQLTITNNDIGSMPVDIVKSAPALDFIEESDEAPPVLPRKKSAASPQVEFRRSIFRDEKEAEKINEAQRSPVVTSSKTLPRSRISHAHSVGDLLSESGATAIERRLSFDNNEVAVTEQPSTKTRRDGKPALMPRPKTMFSQSFATLTRFAKKKNDDKKSPSVSERIRKFGKPSTPD